MEGNAPIRSIFSNAIVLSASAALLLGTGKVLHQQMTSVISVDAVINGTLIDIKAPSQGSLDKFALVTGQITTAGQPIAQLVNTQLTQLQLEELRTQVQSQQAQLQEATARLHQQNQLRQGLVQDQQNQKRLELKDSSKTIAQLEGEIKRTEIRLRLAQKQQARSEQLQAAGAIPTATVEEAQVTVQEKQADLETLHSRLEGLQTNQEAVGLGLSLDHTRSNYDPRIRLEELDLQITAQEQQIATLQSSLNGRQKALKQAGLDWQRQRIVLLKSPLQGVVWQLKAQQGQNVQAGETLGQILDCKRRWVDAWVDEKAVKSITPHMPVTLDLYGTNDQSLQGTVSQIRSGLGRLAPGTDITAPLERNLPRMTQVRIDIQATPDSLRPDRFCYVGYTGRVTFHLPESATKSTNSLLPKH
jgi:multidrug resistance efflux pump